MAGRSRLAGLSGRNAGVTVVLILALAALIAGLVLPVMKVEKLIFWEDSYTLVSGSYNLAKEGDWFLAAVLFTFSVLFPIAKLIVTIVIWVRPLVAEKRARWLRIVAQLGKWSMLDVFVVAFLVVLTKSKALGGIAAQPGLYFFCAAVILSAIATAMVEKRLGDAGGGKPGVPAG